MSKSKRVFYFEHTDLFGGECNYCFLNRFAVKATTERGAVNILSREIGLNHRFDGMKYVSRSGATAFYLVNSAHESSESGEVSRELTDDILGIDSLLFVPVNFERSI